MFVTDKLLNYLIDCKNSFTIRIHHRRVIYTTLITTNNYGYSTKTSIMLPKLQHSYFYTSLLQSNKSMKL